MERSLFGLSELSYDEMEGKDEIFDGGKFNITEHNPVNQDEFKITRETMFPQ